MMAPDRQALVPHALLSFVNMVQSLASNKWASYSRCKSDNFTRLSIMYCLCFRSLTCLLLLSWTILTTWHVIGQFLVRIIWTNLYDCGQSMILRRSKWTPLPEFLIKWNNPPSMSGTVHLNFAGFVKDFTYTQKPSKVS